MLPHPWEHWQNIYTSAIKLRCFAETASPRIWLLAHLYGWFKSWRFHLINKIFQWFTRLKCGCPWMVYPKKCWCPAKTTTSAAWFLGTPVRITSTHHPNGWSQQSLLPFEDNHNHGEWWTGTNHGLSNKYRCLSAIIFRLASNHYSATPIKLSIKRY